MEARERRDVARLCARGALNPESNVCFGAGGAGAFSDGKLTTSAIKDPRAARGAERRWRIAARLQEILVSGQTAYWYRKYTYSSQLPCWKGSGRSGGHGENLRASFDWHFSHRTEC